MNQSLEGRMVVVPASSLAALLELVDLVGLRLPETDQLSSALRAQAMQLRLDSVLEP